MTAKIIEKRVMLDKLTVARGERLVDTIEFSVPELYGIITLYELLPFANIRRSDGTTDKIQLKKGKKITDGYFKVLWDFNASVTAVAGEVEARLSFESPQGDVVYMTEKFTFDVEESIDAFEDYTIREPNALYEQRRMMAEYVVKMEDLVEECRALLDEIKKSK